MRSPSTRSSGASRTAASAGSSARRASRHTWNPRRSTVPRPRVGRTAMTTTADATRTFSVALEGVVYTLVDVHEGHDARFEQWYENDHFYAGGTLAPHV